MDRETPTHLERGSERTRQKLGVESRSRYLLGALFSDSSRKWLLAVFGRASMSFSESARSDTILYPSSTSLEVAFEHGIFQVVIR